MYYHACIYKFNEVNPIVGSDYKTDTDVIEQMIIPWKVHRKFKLDNEIITSKDIVRIEIYSSLKNYSQLFDEEWRKYNDSPHILIVISSVDFQSNKYCTNITNQIMEKAYPIINQEREKMVQQLTLSIEDRQKFRIKILETVATLTNHRVSKTIGCDSEDIEKTLIDSSPIEIGSAITFLCESGYLSAVEATTDADEYDTYICIGLTAKGLRLVERIGTGGTLEDFEKDFSLTILNKIAGNHSTILVGSNNNTINNALQNNDLDKIIQLFNIIRDENPDNPVAAYGFQKRSAGR